MSGRVLGRRASSRCLRCSPQDNRCIELLATDFGIRTGTYLRQARPNQRDRCSCVLPCRSACTPDSFHIRANRRRSLSSRQTATGNSRTAVAPNCLGTGTGSRSSRQSRRSRGCCSRRRDCRAWCSSATRPSTHTPRSAAPPATICRPSVAGGRATTRWRSSFSKPACAFAFVKKQIKTKTEIVLIILFIKSCLIHVTQLPKLRTHWRPHGLS